MSIRLAEGSSGIFSKCLVQKILWGLTVLTLIPLFYFLVVSFKIKRRNFRVKYIIMYLICITEGLLLILHYGFLPSETDLNDYSILVQELVKFVAYFTLVSIMIRDISKINTFKYARYMFALIVGLVLVLLGLIIKEFINTSHQFGTSLMWTFIRVIHLIISLNLIVLGIILTRKSRENMAQIPLVKRQKLKKDLFKLWIIILTTLIESFVHGILDLYILLLDPEDGFKLFDSNAINAIFWFILRVFSVNIWIWPTMIAFNPRDIISQQKNLPNQLLMDSVDQEYSVYENSMKPNLTTYQQKLEETYNIINGSYGTNEKASLDKDAGASSNVAKLVFTRKVSESEDSD